VKRLVPVLAAGGTFAAAAILGLLGGVVAAGRAGEPLLVPVGLLLGAAIGGYWAFRVLVRAMR
jgi:hypothetical protein